MRKDLHGLLALGFFSMMAASAMAGEFSLLPTLDSAYEPYNWSGTYGTVFLGYNKLKSTATEAATVADDATNCAPAGTPGVPANMYWCNVNGQHNYTSTPTLSYNEIGNTWSADTQGITAGIEASRLVQAQGSNIVYGAALDFSYFGNNSKSAIAPLNDDTRLGVDASSYATARVIGGYAYNRWLAYVTGGGAYGNFGNWVEDMDTPVGIRTSPTHGQWGFTVGAGLAFALTEHLSIKGEYDFLDFFNTPTYGYANLSCGFASQDPSVCAGGAGSWKTDPLSNPPTGGFKWNVNQMMSVARIGLAYKF